MAAVPVVQELSAQSLNPDSHVLHDALLQLERGRQQLGRCTHAHEFAGHHFVVCILSFTDHVVHVQQATLRLDSLRSTIVPK
jgi:hypothetical protein